MPIHYRMYVVEWADTDGTPHEHGIDETCLTEFLRRIQDDGGVIDTVKQVVE